ncbi:ACP S-malonyltransferase [Candidatus Albibeggiatoa sp. nov. NOAA]|uniref:ACP S-malonyltransferase n=1 Tax=Candidatus Albibeggiatoa sp. nov. NOAA TaxID=3162724 RepID=UPI0032FFEA97|nr:ACP S-malonyltransferase [Thiotrichaceae bacterium]
MKHAFVFPGQGSQAVGMLAELASVYPIVQQTFEEASEVLKYDLWQLSQNGAAEELNQTAKTQPALLASGIAIWRVWESQGGSKPSVMAGHSFGEYTALVCAETLSYADTVLLAQYRGQFMQQAVPQGVGAMAAIIGLADDKVVEACQQAAENEVVSAVNFNSPGQVVIAGNKAAVERAAEAAKTLGAKKAMLLDVSVPSHCDLMKPAAENMAEKLQAVTMNTPQIPVIHNVDVNTKTDTAQIQQALVEQLYNPVRWVETVQKIAEQDITTLFSAGPGKVLAGLNKRIVKSMNTVVLDTPAGMDKALALAAENEA